MTKRLRSDQGFSLIELLIVTVILGIMAEAVHYGFRLFAKFEASV